MIGRRPQRAWRVDDQFVALGMAAAATETIKVGTGIILGGSAGPKTMADIVEFCDGFMPISGRYDIAEQITQIRQMAEDAGRDPATIEFGQFGTPAKPEIIEQMIEVGLSRILFSLPPADADKVLPLLDRYAEVAGQDA